MNICHLQAQKAGLNSRPCKSLLCLRHCTCICILCFFKPPIRGNLANIEDPNPALYTVYSKHKESDCHGNPKFHLLHFPIAASSLLCPELWASIAWHCDVVSLIAKRRKLKQKLPQLPIKMVKILWFCRSFGVPFGESISYTAVFCSVDGFPLQESTGLVFLHQKGKWLTLPRELAPLLKA